MYQFTGGKRRGKIKLEGKKRISARPKVKGGGPGLGSNVQKLEGGAKTASSVQGVVDGGPLGVVGTGESGGQWAPDQGEFVHKEKTRLGCAKSSRWDAEQKGLSSEGKPRH